MKKYLKIINQRRSQMLLLCIWLSAFHNVFAQHPELIIPATHSANSVVISPNDEWLVSAGAGGLKIWENKTGSLLKNLSPGGRDNMRFNNGRLTMAFNNNSKMLAVQIADTFYFFDFDRFEISNKIKVNGKRTAAIFSSDGQTLYTGGTYNNDGDNFIAEKINIAQGTSSLIQKINFKTPTTHEITRLSISPSGDELLVYDAVTGSWLLDLLGGNIKKEFHDNIIGYPYAYLPGGNFISFSGKNEKGFFVNTLDAKTYRPVKRSKQIFKDINSLNAMEYTEAYYSASGKIILYYQGEFTVFDPADFSFTPKKIFPEIKNYGSNDDKNLAFSPSGNYYVQGGNMTKNNVYTNEVISQYGQFPLDSYVQFVYKNIDGVCLKDRILTFDNGVFNQRLIVPPSDNDNDFFLYRLTADGKTGFIYNQYSGLYRFDPTVAKTVYEPVTKINSMKKNFVGMQIFDHLNLMAMISDEGIYVMDLSTLKVLYIVDIPYGLHYTSFERLNKFCDISPDKTRMILFAESRNDSTADIACVDLSDRNGIWDHSDVNIRNLRFTENGKKLMYSSGDKLYFLDSETGKQVGEPIQLPRSDNETIISPTANIAATQIPIAADINAGSNIGLVDIVNRQSVGTIAGTGDEVKGFVFLRNERYMLTEEFGGLCIWDMEKKRQVGKIYMFEHSGDWVILAPDGRFDATEGALKKMYFTRGKEIIPLESLYEKYYVPGLLTQIWTNSAQVNVPDINDLKSPPQVKISMETKERNLEVADDIAQVKSDKELVNIKIEADGLKDVVSEIRLYQNGKLVQGTRNLTVEDDSKGEKTMVRSFPVTLTTGHNNFRAIAINSQRTESLPAQLIADYTPVVTPPKQNSNIQLYLLVVGVNTYKNPKYNLNYAKADAVAFTDAFKNGAEGLFSDVNTTLLQDADATKEGITAAFEKIKAAARPQDLFVFYYAGHGVLNDKKEFFLVPYDVTQFYGNDGALAQKGFSATALQQMSKEIKAQKQLFILDACQSAGALETIAASRGAAEEKAIAQLARSTGTEWLTASGTEQFASEFSQLGHGSFTYCLLEAFKGDATKDSRELTVKQLDAYLQAKVPEITQKYKGTPQYPASYSYGNDFPIIMIK